MCAAKLVIGHKRCDTPCTEETWRSLAYLKTSIMRKFLKLNLNHRGASHDLLTQTIIIDNVDIILTSKPNKILTKNTTVYTYENLNSTIGVNKNKLQILNTGRSRGHVWIQCGNFIIISCYISNNKYILGGFWHVFRRTER